MLEELLRQFASLGSRVEKLETQEPNQSRYLTLHAYNQLMPVTADGGVLICGNPGTKRIKCLSWTPTTFVGTTNDGTNYWTVDLQYGVTGVNTTLGTFNTSADTVSTWTKHTVTSFTNNPAPTTVSYIFIKVTKTGAPGLLYVTNLLKVLEIT